MTYTLSKETAGYFDAFRSLLKAREQAYEAVTSMYGESSGLENAFNEAIDKAGEELFKLVRINMEAYLAVKESYTEEGVTV